MSPTRPPNPPTSRPLPPKPSPTAPGTPAPKVGERIGKYQLLARLATGGMAELFVARLLGASGFRKNVVIKRILPHVAHDEKFTRMFLDEAITCAQISHPNVCQVFELSESEGSHFLVLEHLEGATVGDLVRRCLAAKQQVNMHVAAGILVQACDGLHAAHEQVDSNDKNVGLVHRDVSPGNLFITVDGIVKVLDFGIAKAAWMSRKTRTGTLLGKCEYMSPEQARGDTPIDRRSDVFSLGIIAWEMLCGRRLFRRKSEYDTLRAVMRDPIEHPHDLRPSIPRSFDRAIMRALERDPDDRYNSAQEFRQAITDALRNHGGVTAMCDIAPVIRTAFADQLRMQRGLIKEATRLTQSMGLPALRAVPRGTIPGSEASEPPVLSRDSDEQGAPPEASLASLSPKSEAVTASMDLTFRDAPKTPPPGARQLPTHRRVTKPERIRAAPVQSEAQPLQQPTPAPSKKSPALSPEKLPAAPPKWTIEAVRQEPAPRTKDVARAKRSAKSSAKQELVLLAIVAILGAAFATILTKFYFSQQEVAPTPKAATKIVAPPMTASPKVTAPPTAAENEQNLTNILAANAEGKAAVVTSLDPMQELGEVSIYSTQPATIYLYPSKAVIGTTPLENFQLPLGKHKLKAQIGGAQGQRKYFHVTIEAGQSTTRTFSKWRRKP